MADPGGWATDGGDKLDADPSTLRGFAKNLAGLSGLLQDDSGNNVALEGIGENDVISRGLMREGKYLAALDRRNVNAVKQFIAGMTLEMQAHSAATFVLADAYETGATNHAIGLNAIDWVYADPNAKRPPGMAPFAYDKDGNLITIQGNQQRVEASNAPNSAEEKLLSTESSHYAVINTYQTADGGTRTVTKVAGGGSYEKVTDKSGAVLMTKNTDANGTVITSSYVGGKEVGTQTHRVPKPETTKTGGTERTHEQTVDVRRNDKGETTVTRHVVTEVRESDQYQRRRYYTEVEKDGKKEITQDRTFDWQPEGVTLEDTIELAEKKTKEMEKAL